MTAPKIQVYEDEGSEWRWRLIAGNGEQVAQGEGHTSEADALRAAHTAADLFDQAIGPDPEDRVDGP